MQFEMNEREFALLGYAIYQAKKAIQKLPDMKLRGYLSTDITVLHENLLNQAIKPAFPTGRTWTAEDSEKLEKRLAVHK